ncbi:uncharacterized protein [Antedon mediterranea]
MPTFVRVPSEEHPFNPKEEETVDKESTQQQPLHSTGRCKRPQRTRGVFSWQSTLLPFKETYAFDSENDNNSNIDYLIASSCSAVHNSDTAKVADILKWNGFTYIRMKPTKDKQTIMSGTVMRVLK